MQTILFVHGMFQTNRSWDQWVTYFTKLGYRCMAPAWPYHSGEPSMLRAQPPEGLGDLRLDEVIDHIAAEITGLPDRPIVIGHSVGGLIVQILASRGLIDRGVAISSVAPNAMLAIDWEFFKNSVKITNPLKGDEPFFMDAKSFHDAFGNTLSESAAQQAFHETAVHDSRNVLRDCMMKPGHVDLDLPHVPLLFIAGDKDHIIPDKLVEKNAQAYTNEGSVTEYKEFAGRSHYICAEPGWEDVAAFVGEWLKRHEHAELHEAPVNVVSKQ